MNIKLRKILESESIILICSRPAVGKTTFSLDLVADDLKRTNNTASILSLEHFSKDIEKKLKLKLDKSEISQSVLIEDRSDIYLEEFKELVKKFQKENGNGIVLIDYFQLLNFEIANSSEIYSKLCEGILQLHSELKCTIIINSQIPRNAVFENNVEIRPTLKTLLKTHLQSLIEISEYSIILHRENVLGSNTFSNDLEVEIHQKHKNDVSKIIFAFESDNQDLLRFVLK